MGELTGSGYTQGDKIAADTAVTTFPDATKEVPDQFKTDVDGVFADGEKSGMPVFDVSSKEFYGNMKTNRLRLRFKSGSNAQSYQSQSKYRRPFWIRNKDDGYTYKIK